MGFKGSNIGKITFWVQEAARFGVMRMLIHMIGFLIFLHRTSLEGYKVIPFLFADDLLISVSDEELYMKSWITERKRWNTGFS